MSKLMWILGVLLAAAGIALGLMAVLSPGRMDIWGVKLDTAAILLVGGILTLGLGGVIDALKSGRGTKSNREEVAAIVNTPSVQEMQVPAGFGRKAAGAAVAATAAIAVEAPKSSVADTIAALDEAKADIKKALGGMDSISTPEVHVEPAHIEATAKAAAESANEATDADPSLFVVEEKIIRGRPARILSDETVEAETDEGWMRFENLEHLNEYLDSTEEPEA